MLGMDSTRKSGAFMLFRSGGIGTLKREDWLERRENRGAYQIIPSPSVLRTSVSSVEPGRGLGSGGSSSGVTRIPRAGVPCLLRNRLRLRRRHILILFLELINSPLNPIGFINQPLLFAPHRFDHLVMRLRCLTQRRVVRRNRFLPLL